MSRFSARLLAMLGVLLCLANPAAASTRDAVEPAVQNTRAIASDYVDIREDSGGRVLDYALRLFDMREAGTKVRFSGRCDSACTLFLALPNRQMCVSPNSYFRFHAPFGASPGGLEAVRAFMMKKYPAWVRSWIARQGGLTSDLITMDYSYARQFVPTCA